jgi:hypothetical protein
MDNDAYEALGAFIQAQNPYAAASEIYFKPGWEAVTMIDTYPLPTQANPNPAALQWNMRLFPLGMPRPARAPAPTDFTVRKAMRLEYQYRDSSGALKTEHLLVGFEGGSGE